MEWGQSFTLRPLYPQRNSSQCPLNGIPDGPQSLWNFWRREKLLFQAENRSSLQHSHNAGYINVSYLQLDWVSEVSLECIREYQFACQMFLLYVTFNSRQCSLYMNHTGRCNIHKVYSSVSMFTVVYHRKSVCFVWLQTLVHIVRLGNIEMVFNTHEFTIYSFSDYSELRRKVSRHSCLKT